jgi:hypothetical protein
MVVALHTSTYTMSATGEQASAGVKSVAETGNPDTLITELTTSAAAKPAPQVTANTITMDESGTVSTTGSSGAEWLQYSDFIIEADSDMPHVSMITMIAPSPDWYAFGTAALYENGAFAASKTVDMYAYDAGTDDGATYTAADSATSPQVNIADLDHGVAGASTQATDRRHMMTMTFTRSCCYTVSQSEEQWVTNYGENLPADPHYSRMFFASHTSDYTMSEVGQAASTGLQSIAETGSPDGLTTEVTAASDATVLGTMAPTTTGTGATAGARTYADFRFAPSTAEPMISMVTMIAPSPDWYAFGSATLYTGGSWASPVEVDMYAYDAGTDDGTTYAAADSATSPQGNIADLDHGVAGASTTATDRRLMMKMTFTADSGCSLGSGGSTSSANSIGAFSWYVFALSIIGYFSAQ